MAKKQLGVRVEEEVIKRAKLKCIEEGISLSFIVNTVLEQYVAGKVTFSKPTAKIGKSSPAVQEEKKPSYFDVAKQKLAEEVDEWEEVVTERESMDDYLDRVLGEK